MKILKSSVGRGGANQPRDVRIVQALLNDCLQGQRGSAVGREA